MISRSLALLLLVLGASSAGCDDGGEGRADGGDADAVPDGDGDDADVGPLAPCPDDMALIDDGQGPPFCIDRYEHPDRAGELPTIGRAWFQAAEACVEERKELCRDEQWARACDGTPAEACRGPIGAAGLRPDCISRFGVHDLPGNVAEWTADVGFDFTYLIRGGRGEDGEGDGGISGEVGCGVREQFDAEERDEALGLRCCRQAWRR